MGTWKRIPADSGSLHFSLTWLNIREWEDKDREYVMKILKGLRAYSLYVIFFRDYGISDSFSSLCEVCFSYVVEVFMYGSWYGNKGMEFGISDWEILFFIVRTYVYVCV